MIRYSLFFCPFYNGSILLNHLSIQTHTCSVFEIKVVTKIVHVYVGMGDIVSIGRFAENNGGIGLRT